MNSATLLTFTLTSALLALVPGPDNLFVLTQSALQGRRAGILITLGLCTGLIVHTTAVALGLAALFAASQIAYTVVTLLGAAYLLYLAWQAYKASRVSGEPTQGNGLSGRHYYVRGIIMNLSNPKVVIFFLAFLPQFIDPEAGKVSLQLFALGLIFIATTILVFGTIALLSSSLSALLRENPAIRRWMERITCVLFTGLALRLLLTNL